MSIFKSKSSTTLPKRKPMELELRMGPDERFVLAFGMQWSPIVTANGEQVALSMARKRRATHYMYAQQHVGVGQIPAKLVPDKLTPIYSAANIVAHQFGGNAIHVIKVTDNEYWICQIRNSHPSGVDRFIYADSDAPVLEEAERIYQAAETEGLTLDVYTNIEYHRFSKARTNNIHDMCLACAANPQDPVVAVSRADVKVPKPVLVILAAALLVFGGQRLWQYQKVREAASKAAPQMVPDEPAEVAWDRAVKTWRKTLVHPDKDSYKTVRQAMDKIPVQFHGWWLTTATCAADKVKDTETEKDRAWSCSASYLRSPTGKLAKDISTLTPAGWSVSFTPLNVMTGSWQVRVPVKPIDFATLDKVDKTLITSISNLQRIQSTVEGEPTLAFTAMVIPPPLKRNGTPYTERPDLGIEAFSSAIVINAPLRTMDTLVAQDIPVEWTAIRIELVKDGAVEKPSDQAIVVPGSELNRGVPPSNKSALRANITGVIYANNK